MDKKTEKLFAMKTVAKYKINKGRIEKHILMEKEVLEFLNFSFIVKLYKIFIDECSVYFLLNLVKGIEMFDMMRQIDLFEIDECRFYVGSLLLCLEYLH